MAQAGLGWFLMGATVVAGCHLVAGLDELGVEGEGGAGGRAPSASASQGTPSSSAGDGGRGGSMPSPGSGGTGGVPSVVSTGVGGANGQCCGYQASAPGCRFDPGCEACVCACDASCCNAGWDNDCAMIAESNCYQECGCTYQPNEKLCTDMASAVSSSGSSSSSSSSTAGSTGSGSSSSGSGS